VKKFFVLMFVVVAILGFVATPTTKNAEAGGCQTGYLHNYDNKTYEIFGETTVAARLIVHVDLCYNRTASVDAYVWGTTQNPSPHPRWDDGTITVSRAGLSCSVATPGCDIYKVHVQFNRTYADGSWRQPICVDHFAEFDGLGRISFDNTYSKYLC
jgi:hypothetical protein